MSEQLVDTINAGSRPAYDILVTEKDSIRIRLSEDHRQYVDVDASAIPNLISILREAQKIAESRRS